MKLKTEFVKSFVKSKEIKSIQPEVEKALKTVLDGTGAGADFRGWVDLPVNYDKQEFVRIQKAASYIKKHCQVFLVIGIGGSYLGARAAIEFCKSNNYNLIKHDTPNIYFVGNSISPSYLQEIKDICDGKDVCLNVISKSGTTTEPAIAFRIFREYLENKYGVEEASRRIFVTTDKSKGALHFLSNQMGYESFVVPDDIGGRYSVLTAVGLLPIAVSGINIEQMMNGATEAREKYLNADFCHNDCLKYAAYRNILYRNKKCTEILVSYEPSVQLFSEWWKQLYGESEGKDGKGLYPSSVVFSTDLHSLGQFIQEGSRNIFETVLSIKTSDKDVIIPFDESDLDGLNYLSGRSMNEVNITAMQATLLAHTAGDVPNLVLEVKDRSAKVFGHLVYFFELACAVSGYTLGINPFNQTGVEAYKKNMFAMLGKPGYEELGKSLLNH